jgi:rhomboid protease GluP
MCQACRALVPASEKSCPMCGRESVPARPFLHATTGGHFISIIILTINILLFVLMAMVEIRNGAGGEAFVKSASGTVLGDFGALSPVAVNAGQWWRLVTMNFLHIGLMHLLFNSVALYQVGPQVEELIGSAKFIFIYLATGIVSAIASYFAGISGAGASGALFGLIGLMAAYGFRRGGSVGRMLMQQMLSWAATAFIFGYFIGANNVAHAGGFVAGVALAFVVPAEPPTTHRSGQTWNAVMIACVLVVATSFAMVGRHFGEEQETAVGGRNVIALSERVRGAIDAANDSLNAMKTKKDPQQIADSLRSAARDITMVPHIDDRSDEIKQQLADLLTKRADAFQAAAKAPKSLSSAVDAEWDGIDAALNSYFDWEESVLNTYQLQRQR